jgi:DNA mismatch repair protein MutL
MEIEVTGGVHGDVAPCGCPVGTTVEVHNLFFNTPVRRKFLRTTQTELGHVSEAFTRIALALPRVHFTLRHNDRPMFELTAADGPLERIARFFGRELAENLIWVESANGPVRVSGYAAHPAHSRSNNKMQYFFLNGRHIHDRSLQHALGEAYRGLLMTGRYPIAVLTLEMPPEMVDVNVHPTKLEVRFQDSGRLYSQLLATLRGKFLTTDLNTRVGQVSNLPNAGHPANLSDHSDPTGSHDPARAAELRQELVAWAKGKMASWGGAEGEASSQATGTQSLDSGQVENLPHEARQFAFDPGHVAAERRPLELTILHRGGLQPAPVGQCSQPTPSAPAEATPMEAAPFGPSPPRPHALQIHNRYLVTESHEGVTIIDQHALHERILYEQLRARIAAGAMETQQLLVPEPVDLGPSEAAAALQNRDVLARLGMKIEPFGGDTVLVVGFPAMLANMGPVEVLRELVERLLAGGRQPGPQDLVDELLHTIACKAAIKAGDRLSPDEINTLLEQRYLVDDAHHCPHGRPTALVFTREELDKQFKRI